LMLGGCNTMEAGGSADASASATGGMSSDMTPNGASAYVQLAASTDMYEINPRSSPLGARRIRPSAVSPR
jgi:hypothetical protein